MGTDLEGRRVVVVGASAGIGRAVAMQAVRTGADVVLAARRADALAAAVAEAGGGVGMPTDVTDAASRAALVEDAVAHLGSVDLLVHTVGYSALRGLTAVDEHEWHDALAANVVGFNQLVRLFLPSVATGGIVAAVSSESVVTPWAGLVPYTASKAALETSIRGWRLEHPEVRFTCLALGATQPTDFGAAFDRAELGTAMESWTRHGMLHERFMDTDDVAGFLVSLLGLALDHPEVGVETLVLRSPSPVARPHD